MRRSLCVMAAALVISLSCGCGKKYWEPTVAERVQAEEVARLHVYRELSDQAREGRAESLVLDPATGLPKEYPIAFTLGGTPYARYRQKYWGGIRKGVKYVHVQYFDATRITDWEKPEATGAFPAHFSVAVDLAGRKAETDTAN